MKITNTSNYRKQVNGTWFEPGETKEVEDIREDNLSYHFKLEDETTSGEDVKDGEETSKPESKKEENSKGE